MTTKAPPPTGHYNETIRALSEITDAGLFEHLATAVLRAAQPELYGHLTQTGINVNSRPVKSPVDAISYVPGTNPPHLVTVHHTTSKRDDLRKKWLHDSSVATTKGRKKHSASEGDLTKTAALVTKERNDNPSLIATLALTTNEEPPEDLTREAHRVARAHGITLDIWSRSRLADILDNTSGGQWLRRRYLGIEQVKLSAELLHELSQQSLAMHLPLLNSNELVIREDAMTLIDGVAKPVAFLIGESGYGKSVICHQQLARHIAQGGSGLILRHAVLSSCVTLDQAIDSALRELHPALAPGTGAEARSFCTTASPFLIVVEDVNQSDERIHLIERIAQWSVRAESNGSTQQRNWQIFCPFWPAVLGALSDDVRRHVESLSTHLGVYGRADSRAAVLKRAEAEGLHITALDADVLAENLSHDPLLIGLCKPGSDAAATKVISGYITRCTEQLASGKGTRTPGEYRVALRSLANLMLEHRTVSPIWTEVVAWYRGSLDELGTLRELVKQAAVIRIPDSQENAQLQFRHDRVRNWLLSDAMAHAIVDHNLDDSIFANPFFADILGAVLASPLTKKNVATRAREGNPLALFYAFQAFLEPTAGVHFAVLDEIDRWLSLETTHTRANQSLRHAALNLLSRTQSKHVLPMLSRFPDRTWTKDIAGLRNNDIGSGINLCRSLEPGTNAHWRDQAVDHAIAHFGKSLVNALDQVLKKPDISSAKTIGALRLAGHIADPSLAKAIAARWANDEDKTSHLDDYLWSCAQCGGEHTEAILSPVCDAWALLPDAPKKEGLASPRDDLAAYGIAWAFWRRLPLPALTYFIKRAGEDDLRWPITYMLHGVDHPDAVEFIANQLAARSRELAGSDNFNLFSRTVTGHWSRRQRDQKKPMNSASRNRLQKLWEDGDNDRHLRQHAFRMWAASSYPNDISILSTDEFPSFLKDDVLRARLERSDKSAVPMLIKKIKEQDKHNYWWQHARDVWTDELTAFLDEQLAIRASTVSPYWGRSIGTDWMLSEMVIRQDQSTAEKLLRRYWENLRFSPQFFQAALYVATPRMLELVKNAIAECTSPEEMFKHITHHFGIKTIGHPGVTRIEQVRGLVPYLDHIDDMEIHQFWELCNERGWVALRRENLDCHLSGKWRKLSGLDDATLYNELDEELTNDKRPWMDYWVEKQLDNGRSRENILSVIQSWLIANQTTKALEVAASVVVHSGSRIDIDLLSEGCDQIPLADEIIQDTAFAVKKRRLS